MKLLAPLLFVAAVGLFNPHRTAAAEGRAAAKQGAGLLKADIMAVYAHPDDETGAAAALAFYALGKDKVVAAVYCTRGEGGGNMVGTQWGPSLGVLREAELRRCLGRLGVRYCYFLDQQDFFYTESVAATLQKWGKERTLERLVRLIRAMRPEVVITMNPAPTPGQHGHHQAAAVLATEAFDAAANAARFPEQLKKEGLGVWKVRKLYFGGGGPKSAATIAVTTALPGGRTAADVAALAASEHRSQGFGGFANSPWMRRPQTFSLAKSVLPFAEAEDDLFRGLPISEALSTRVIDAPASPGGGAAVTVGFVPRPAIAEYRQWAEAQGVEHLSTTLVADVPVVAGEAGEIRVEVRNSDREAVRGELQLSTAIDWRIEPSSLDYQVGPGETQTLRFRLTPPAAASADAEIVATTKVRGATVKGVAMAHPVPLLSVARVDSPPAIDGSDAGWAGVPSHEIPPTSLVQGRVKDAADSGARFRLAHDGVALFVDVEVSDDAVVSNIAPDDIRGHWRSDSIEICIDPAGGAEHTLDCFKVGVFPFDSTGVVRAARDADANQGPVGETAPTMRVASKRTPGGYRVQAAIPFTELAPGFAARRRVGFNLIVYDGDKLDAAPGENINKSRIAWSPRAGVQGRPEDWGRVDIK